MCFAFCGVYHRKFCLRSVIYLFIFLQQCGLAYSHVVVQHLWGEVRLPVRQLLFGCVGVVAPSSGGGTHGHGTHRATRSSGSGPGRETRDRGWRRVGGRWLVYGAVSSLWEGESVMDQHKCSRTHAHTYNKHDCSRIWLVIINRRSITGLYRVTLWNRLAFLQKYLYRNINLQVFFFFFILSLCKTVSFQR